MKQSLTPLILLLVAVALHVLTFIATQGTHIYPGEQRIGVPAPPIAVPGFEVWWLETEQGKVEAWWLPGAGVSADRPGPVVMYFHNGEDFIDDIGSYVSAYRPIGVSVLVAEYRGYGRSEGTPSQEAIMSDSVAWHERLMARPEVAPDRVAYQGRALGAAAAIHLARTKRPQALILESPFTSMRRVARDRFLPESLVWDPWDNLSVSLEPAIPAAVFHGRSDDEIPHRDGERVARHLSAVLHSYESGHDDLPPDREVHHAHIVALLSKAGVL